MQFKKIKNRKDRFGRFCQNYFHSIINFLLFRCPLIQRIRAKVLYIHFQGIFLPYPLQSLLNLLQNHIPIDLIRKILISLKRKGKNFLLEIPKGSFFGHFGLNFKNVDIMCGPIHAILPTSISYIYDSSSNNRVQ